MKTFVHKGTTAGDPILSADAFRIAFIFRVLGCLKLPILRDTCLVGRRDLWAVQYGGLADRAFHANAVGPLAVALLPLCARLRARVAGLHYSNVEYFA